MNKSIIIALVITVAATLWVLSGLNKNPDEAESSAAVAESEAKNEKLPEVRVQNLTAQIMDDQIEVTGRTQASRQVIVRAETEGQIASLLVKKGDVVTQGQVLAKMEIKDRTARVEEAIQNLKQREIQYQASKELAEKGYNSRVRLAETQANLQSAKAQVKQAQEELSNIIIKAPFNGVINDQMVEIGDYVSKANPMFEIVDLNPIEISGFLTEKQVGSLKEGDKAEAVLLNTQLVNGTVTFVAAAADPDTRTFKIEITVANDDQSIKDGLTAKILVPFKEDKAYKVSPSILSLADDGTIGVKIVNQNNIVEFKTVKLLKDTPEYLWIGGLPDSVRIITVGQEFVTAGQKVNPVVVKPNEGKSLL